MSYCRIMCVGPSRINETMATLAFDHQHTIQFDITYIISPYSPEVFYNLFEKFNIDFTKFEILDDTYFSQIYDLSKWSHDNWYKQQAFKLCALDYFNHDRFLIQDCDLILLEPYTAFIDNKPNFKAEPLWNEYHTVYADMVTELIQQKRIVDISLVNELMPYHKKDWLLLKQHLEQLHNKSFLDAIPDLKEFDETKWFSEYELLGIFKTNLDQNWTYFSNVSQPAIHNWEQFYNHNWKCCNSVKFHARPLKFMTEHEASDVINHIKLFDIS